MTIVSMVIVVVFIVTMAMTTTGPNQNGMRVSENRSMSPLNSGKGACSQAIEEGDLGGAWGDGGGGEGRSFIRDKAVRISQIHLLTLAGTRGVSNHHRTTDVTGSHLPHAVLVIQTHLTSLSTYLQQELPLPNHHHLINHIVSLQCLM